MEGSSWRAMEASRNWVSSMSWERGEVVDMEVEAVRKDMFEFVQSSSGLSSYPSSCVGSRKDAGLCSCDHPVARWVGCAGMERHAGSAVVDGGEASRLLLRR